MDITITNIVSSTDFDAPNRPVDMLTVHYQTGNGYKSSLKIRKADFDKSTIYEMIKKDCGAICSSIGETRKI